MQSSSGHLHLTVADMMDRCTSLPDYLLKQENKIIRYALERAVIKKCDRQWVADQLGLKSRQALDYILNGRHKDLRDILPPGPKGGLRPRKAK